MASVLSSSTSAQAVVDNDAASTAASTDVHTTHHSDCSHNPLDGVVVAVKAASLMLGRLRNDLQGLGLVTEGLLTELDRA